jgi:predicted phage terminase large subunit-like protein
MAARARRVAPKDQGALALPAMAPALHGWAEHVLRPMDYTPARHHRALLDRLALIGEGAIDRLMVLMPPGSAKSTYASMIFPAWWLARHPTSSVIAASHTAELADHFGRRLRNLIAEEAEVLGYGLSGDSRAAHRFRTSAGGEYFATGIHGPVTGRRADLVVIDDPIKSHAESESELSRNHLWNWYRSELTTRLKPGGRIVLVMTRWHEDDLGGRLMEAGDDWHQLRLPALAEAGDPLKRRPGEALWPEWEDAATLSRKRAAVGSRVWQALYQQSPTPAEGSLFPVARVGMAEMLPEGARMVRAWDLAASEATSGSDPDWTVGLKLAACPDGALVVVDVLRFRGGPHAVVDAILRTASRDGREVAIGLPQDPGQAGKQQVAWLSSQLGGFSVLSSPETGAKLVRAMPVAAMVEAGRLRLLRAGWNDAFLGELRDFPHGRKDDQVDALSRAFSMLAQAGRPARQARVGIMGR